MYKQTYNAQGQLSETMIVRTADNTFIPFDPANSDAQQFAKWLQEGNLPEPAEEGVTVTQEWATETIAKLLPNG
jgi:hypothetical protein